MKLQQITLCSAEMPIASPVVALYSLGLQLFIFFCYEKTSRSIVPPMNSVLCEGIIDFLFFLLSLNPTGGFIDKRLLI